MCVPKDITSLSKLLFLPTLKCWKLHWFFETEIAHDCPLGFHLRQESGPYTFWVFMSLRLAYGPFLMQSGIRPVTRRNRPGSSIPIFSYFRRLIIMTQNKQEQKNRILIVPILWSYVYVTWYCMWSVIRKPGGAATASCAFELYRSRVSWSCPFVVFSQPYWSGPSWLSFISPHYHRKFFFWTRCRFCSVHQV